jgi:hypothetical protein
MGPTVTLRAAVFRRFSLRPPTHPIIAWTFSLALLLASGCPADDVGNDGPEPDFPANIRILAGPSALAPCQDRMERMPPDGYEGTCAVS